jgi:hypothetical protein
MPQLGPSSNKLVQVILRIPDLKMQHLYAFVEARFSMEECNVPDLASLGKQ